MKETILKKLEEIELKIFIYGDRDEIALKRLEKQKRELEMQLLDYMTANRGL